jgi:hypothetical protein
MNDIVCVTIPEDHVELVAETVLGLYGAHAEALGATALAFLDGSDELAELEHARGELRAIEDALTDLGWPRSASAGPVELVGPPRLLRELIRAALLDAAAARRRGGARAVRPLRALRGRPRHAELAGGLRPLLGF